jgi:GT2 family glycosyltransferase
MSLPQSDCESEWIWLIHDDCAPQPGALEALLNAVSERPHVAIAGPKLLGWYDRSHLLEVGVTIAGNGARWTGLEPHEYDQGQHDGIREVLSVSTAGALIRRRVFEELEGFDPNLALFRDDVDFGWRAHVAGHTVIAVSDAVAFHAEASASERRTVDVKGALLNRPLILDRRNAAFVLLANSSWWMLPWLTMQLFFGSAMRSLGYLLAKLPGYASDEFLAVALLLVRPTKLWEARKRRKRERLISSRTVSRFIPPRWSQLRLGVARVIESIRQTILPAPQDTGSILDQLNEEEDLLTPSTPLKWRSAFRRPEVAGAFFLLFFVAMWSTHRYGSLSGGALETSPSGAADLWSIYGQSWHQIAMGSSSSSTPWILLLAILSTIFFGKAVALMTFLFWVAPLLMALSSYFLLRRFSQNPWLIVGASIAYAISPVSIAAINSGRLGTIVALIVAPRIVSFLPGLIQIETATWRLIFGVSLLVSIVTSFSLIGFLGFIIVVGVGATRDFMEYKGSADKPLFINRMRRRSLLALTPFLLCLPWSFEALVHPSRFLLEPGLLIEAGVPNMTLLANPGGPGSLPWWVISPITFVLFVSAFSTAKVRRYANFGIFFVLISTLLSAFSISGHGSSASFRVWTGTLLGFASIAALCSGVIILDGLRQRLANVHFHFRHVLGGLVIATSVLYVLTASTWAVSTNANAPVQSNRAQVLPAFLAVTPGVKTMVMRNLGQVDAPSFFIARESDAMLGDADMSPENSADVVAAVRQIVDGSGITSSRILAGYGIKYLYVINPANPQLVRSIDGLGGFIRMSSTQAGTVWRVSGISDRLVFTNTKGQSQALPTLGTSAHGVTPSAGTLSLAENFDSSWQIIQSGQHLVRAKNAFGLPQFQSTVGAEFILIHDGTKRRAWLALEMIVFLTVLVMATPSGRRRKDISRDEMR